MSVVVSIIIPCFNGEAYVSEAIGSALAQTYADKEVIVIDDGSTDRTLDIVKSFRQVQWISGPRRGGGAARNEGLRLARGQLVQFLDADDLLHPRKLEIQVPLVAKAPGAVSFCDVSVVDMATGRPIEVLASHEPTSVRRCCFDKIQTSAPIHWKSDLDALGGFTEGLDCAQEFDLHLRQSCSGIHFSHTPQVLVTMRRRAGSVSSDYARVMKQLGPIVTRASALLTGSRSMTTIVAPSPRSWRVPPATYWIEVTWTKRETIFARLAEFTILAACRPSGRCAALDREVLGVEPMHGVLRRLSALRRSIAVPKRLRVRRASR